MFVFEGKGRGRSTSRLKSYSKSGTYNIPHILVAGTSEYQAAWLLDSSEDEDEEDDEEEEEDGGDAAMAGRDGSDEEAPELEDLVDEEDGTGEC